MKEVMLLVYFLIVHNVLMLMYFLAVQYAYRKDIKENSNSIK